ncbi:hypothetical protein PYJP_13800 [Pyrofollis japonicus]|uniref:hypothetical protein n=1 Tax=Pyrofollis japonicus TaxID=3060460 RepID=UPI00295BFC39|nr:hypothetical protein [Pyrofollis japonicus]BEP18028.1 hypothetical protein PYJP_13800 [Pyrofollis japonicus]
MSISRQKPWSPSRVAQPPVEGLELLPVQGSSDTTGMTSIEGDTTQAQSVAGALALSSRIITRLAKALWKQVRPREIASLRPGEIRRLSRDLIVEKTGDGRIIIYEIEE